MRQRRPMRGVIVLLCAALLVGSGCARFDEAQSQPFTTQPELKPGPSSSPPPPPPLPPKPFPKVCPPPDVIHPSLQPTSGHTILPAHHPPLTAVPTTRTARP